MPLIIFMFLICISQFYFQLLAIAERNIVRFSGIILVPELQFSKLTVSYAYSSVL